MAGKRYLCPVDLSHFSDQAVEVASQLANADQGCLVFLFVALPELPIAAGMAIPEVNSAIEDQRAQFQQIRPTVSGVPFEHHLVRGEPVQAILDAVASDRIDMIVMPTHGRTGLSRLLMGSVAEHVVRRATCPVLIVKSPAKH